MAVASLTPDPRNARRHGTRNLDLIAQSLREVGAARSIVVDEDGTVLAGNATVAAAANAGIARVRVVEADGTELVAVRRTGLSPEQKRRLALFDNRAAELADWDAAALASLTEDTDLSGLWGEDDLAATLAGAEATAVVAPEAFGSYGDDLPTAYRCPSCGHEWSGKQK
jgi:ParB-like chromosome segregation protein Spo0J